MIVRLPRVQEKRELLPRILAHVPAERAHNREDEGLRQRDQEHSGEDLSIRGSHLKGPKLNVSRQLLIGKSQ